MKVAIVGGNGQMGQWLARFLKSEGMDVVLVGRNQLTLREVAGRLECWATTKLEELAEVDAVIVSVSIDAFEEVIRQVAPFTRQGQMVFDVTSVKVMPVEIMHRHIDDAVVLGTHPVFGPGARSAAGHNFVLTPTGPQEDSLAEKVKGFLEKCGAFVRIMSPEEHDRLMAIILGLAHFISIVSANTLVDYGKLTEMAGVQGVTYRALLTLVESVLSENPELYASLQMNLPHLRQAQQIFIDNARLWTDIVSQQDREAFISRMKKLRDQFESSNPDFGRAYDNMYRLSGQQPEGPEK